MKKMVLILITCLAIIFNCSTIILAEDLTQTYEVSKGVHINLPGNWVQMPKDQVDELTKALFEKTIKKEILIDRIFYNEQNGTFEYPYLMVKVLDGRFPEKQLSDLKVIDDAFESSMQMVEQSELGITATNIGQTIYIKDKNIIYNMVQSEVADDGIGVINAITVIKLTAVNSVEFVFYCPDSLYTQYSEVIESMINSIEVDQSFLYRTLGKQNSIVAFVITLIPILFLGLIFLFVRKLFRRRNRLI